MRPTRSLRLASITLLSAALYVGSQAGAVVHADPPRRQQPVPPPSIAELTAAPSVPNAVATFTLPAPPAPRPAPSPPAPARPRDGFTVTAVSSVPTVFAPTSPLQPSKPDDLTIDFSFSWGVSHATAGANAGPVSFSNQVSAEVDAQTGVITVSDKATLQVTSGAVGAYLSSGIETNPTTGKVGVVEAGVVVGTPPAAPAGANVKAGLQVDTNAVVSGVAGGSLRFGDTELGGTVKATLGASGTSEPPSAAPVPVLRLDDPPIEASPADDETLTVDDLPTGELPAADVSVDDLSADDVSLDDAPTGAVPVADEDVETPASAGTALLTDDDASTDLETVSEAAVDPGSDSPSTVDTAAQAVGAAPATNSDNVADADAVAAAMSTEQSPPPNEAADVDSFSCTYTSAASSDSLSSNESSDSGWSSSSESSDGDSSSDSGD